MVARVFLIEYLFLVGDLAEHSCRASVALTKIAKSSFDQAVAIGSLEPKQTDAATCSFWQ